MIAWYCEAVRGSSETLPRVDEVGGDDRIAIAVLRVAKLERVCQAVSRELGERFGERRDRRQVVVDVQQASVEGVQHADGGAGRCLAGIERVGILAAEGDPKDLARQRDRAAAAEGDPAGCSEAPPDAAGGVEAAGDELVVAPPQAVTIIKPAPSRPSSRLCIDSPPNGFSTRKSLATEVRSRIQRRCVSPSFRSSLPLDAVDGRAAATARFRSVRCRYYPQRLADCQLPA